MSISDYAFGLRNEYQYRVIDDDQMEWSAYKTYIEGKHAYVVLLHVEDTSFDLLTDNEEEAAHYMASISDKWEPK